LKSLDLPELYSAIFNGDIVTPDTLPSNKLGEVITALLLVSLADHQMTRGKISEAVMFINRMGEEKITPEELADAINHIQHIFLVYFEDRNESPMTFH